MKQITSIKSIMAFSLLCITGTAFNSDQCPSVYEKYHFELKDVDCYDIQGNPTGKEKKDCVDASFKCCNTDMQTACSGTAE